jgi:hypothetical protein
VLPARRLDISIDNSLIFPDICNMSTGKKNSSKKKAPKSSGNPFVQLIEDKKKINEKIKNGKSLSTLKGIKFVKPI